MLPLSSNRAAQKLYAAFPLHDGALYTFLIKNGQLTSEIHVYYFESVDVPRRMMTDYRRTTNAIIIPYFSLWLRRVKYKLVNCPLQ